MHPCLGFVFSEGLRLPQGRYALVYELQNIGERVTKIRLTSYDLYTGH